MMFRWFRRLLGGDASPKLQSAPEPSWCWPGPRPGATVIFLDFDGVIHRAENGSFEFIPNLVMLLEGNENVDVVLSTNWRESCTPLELLAYFPVEVQHRIVGMTPVLEGSRARERECLAYAQEHRVRHYVAVDDDDSLFSDGCAFLFRTGRHWGLDDEATARLSRYLDALQKQAP